MKSIIKQLFSNSLGYNFRLWNKNATKIFNNKNLAVSLLKKFVEYKNKFLLKSAFKDLLQKIILANESEIKNKLTNLFSMEVKK